MNLFIVSGRIVKDLELFEYKKDKFLCNFTIANNVYAGDGEEKTNFFRCVIFGKTAESFVEYNHKGDSVILRGRLDLGSYENEDGEEVRTTTLIVESWEMGARVKNSKKKSVYHGMKLGKQ